MRWEQGAYVFVPNNGSLPASYAYMGMRYDPTVWLDDEDPNILSIPANVDRINGLMDNQAAASAFAALQQANAIAAVVRSPAGDAMAQAAAAAYSAVATKNVNAADVISTAQDYLADIASGDPTIEGPAMAAVEHLDRAAETLNPGSAFVPINLSATPGTLDNPLLITGAPTVQTPQLPASYPTQPLHTGGPDPRPAVGPGSLPPAGGLPWWLIPVALFFLGRGTR